MSHVVIIGNGIAGITAARHIRKFSDKKITVISAETEYFFSPRSSGSWEGKSSTLP